MARVSIIIPCYNAAAWLAETLESALAQTHADTEIIVIDDGSRDESLRVANQFVARGVRVVSQPNRGAAAARNHGLRLATGEFIQFLDADDLLTPDKIARQLIPLQTSRHSLASAAWGRFSDVRARAQFHPEPNWSVSDPVTWLCENFAGRGMMPPIAWLTPRSLIERAGQWDERLTLNDDGEYFCRILLAAERIHFCPEVHVFYRSQIAGSLSRRTSRQAWESALLSHDLCAKHLLSHENSPRSRKACADLYQRLAYAMYPDCPDLVRGAEASARRHGGSRLRPGGGRLFAIVAALGGWKLARSCQHISQRRKRFHP